MSGAIVVRHDLLEGERVLRRVEADSRVVERTEITLEHGCLSCTVRLDVVPTVLRILDGRPAQVLLGLPPTSTRTWCWNFSGRSLNGEASPWKAPVWRLTRRHSKTTCGTATPSGSRGSAACRATTEPQGNSWPRRFHFPTRRSWSRGFSPTSPSRALRDGSGGELFLRGIQLLEELGPHLVRSHPDQELRLGQHAAGLAIGRGPQRGNT